VAFLDKYDWSNVRGVVLGRKGVTELLWYATARKECDIKLQMAWRIDSGFDVS
jgi:hypothetical protein